MGDANTGPDPKNGKRGDCPWGLKCLDLVEDVENVHMPHLYNDSFGIYIPHKTTPPLGSAPTSSIEMAKSISDVLFKNKLAPMFKNTTIERRTKQVIQDYVLAQTHGQPLAGAFEFADFPLQVIKGGMEKDCVEIYSSRGIPQAEIFSRALRDFYTSINYMQFLRGFQKEDISLCGSLLCMTIMVDNCGAPDDSGTGVKKDYELAYAEGLYKFKERALQPIIKEVLLTCTGMLLKEATLQKMLKFSAAELFEDFGATPTPEEFLKVRWWDAAMSPYYKAPLSLAHGANLKIDKNFAPTETSSCNHLRKALDLIVRYDEIVDVHHDVKAKEPFNELHIAGRYGGIEAIRNYADACAACVDDWVDCKCPISDQVRDYGVDVAVGCAMWYVLIPRYRGLSQLAEFWDLTSKKYETLLEESRHGPWLTSRYAVCVKDAGLIHDDDWKSCYVMTGPTPNKSGGCEHCDLITKWILNRCVYLEQTEQCKPAIKELVSKVHLTYDKDVPGFWEEIMEIVLKGVAIRNMEIKNKCVAAVMATWNLMKRIEAHLVTPRKVAKEMWILMIDIDSVVIDTHDEEYGYLLRKYVVGVLSCMIERTYFAPYRRILDVGIMNGTTH